jgi:Reverse transcriptase (RNA-dependent DNA polymerase)
MNNFFLSVGESTTVASAPNLRNVTTSNLRKLWLEEPPCFHPPQISEAIILEIIESFHSKTLAGWDGIPITLLKKCSIWFAIPLAHIINESFKSGVFPEKMKYADILPILKKGDKSLASNYRPIALLTSFSKIIEKTMHISLLRHLESTNMLSEDQHGFRAGRSTTSATFQLLGKVISALENNKQAGAVFCDLSKAFDVLDHELLLGKLASYGITGTGAEWFRSYLTGRSQRVKIGASGFSSWEIIKRGVPQGSILGPLLFSVMVNDMATSIDAATNRTNSKIIQFADDTTAIVESHSLLSLADDLNATTLNLTDWFSNNLLTLNQAKTQFVVFSPRGERNLPCASITTVNCTKFLGLMIDNQLKWTLQITELVGRVTRAGYAIRTLARKCDAVTVRTAYFALVHSILLYGIVFWGTTPECHRVFVAQKKIIRIMKNLRPRESCKASFTHLRILPLPCIYIQQVALFTRDNLHLFPTSNHSHNTRTATALSTNSCRLKLTSRSNLNEGRKIFNKLPVIVKDATQRNVFKDRLNEFLLDKLFYNLDDYLCN